MKREQRGTIALRKHFFKCSRAARRERAAARKLKKLEIKDYHVYEPDIDRFECTNGAIIVRCRYYYVEGIHRWSVHRGAVRLYRTWKAAYMAANR